jgi:hypothetical protein
MKNLINRFFQAIEMGIQQLDTISFGITGIESEMRHAKNRIELSEFLEKYSLRIKKVVDSCNTELQLQFAEQYIRNGISYMVRNPNGLVANDYVNSLIIPKRIELEAKNKGVTIIGRTVYSVNDDSTIETGTITDVTAIPLTDEVQIAIFVESMESLTLHLTSSEYMELVTKGIHFELPFAIGFDKKEVEKYIK